MCSLNQVLTLAARAAAKQLFRHLWWPLAAGAKGSGQSNLREAVKRASCSCPTVRMSSRARTRVLLVIDKISIHICSMAVGREKSVSFKLSGAARAGRLMSPRRDKRVDGYHLKIVLAKRWERS